MKRFLTLIFVGLTIGRGLAQNVQIQSLAKDFRAGRVATWRATAALVGQDLSVAYTTLSPYPSLTINRAVPSDWSSYDAYLFDVYNPNIEPLLFYLRIDNNVNANGVINCRTGWAYIEPGQRKTYAFPLRMDPNLYGMKAVPGLQGSTWLAMNNSVLDISHVVRSLLYLSNPQQPYQLVLSNPRLVRVDATHMLNIVDKFGQFTGADWPNKIHSDAEFGSLEAAEQLDLAAHPALPNRDPKGGWTGGLNFTANGRFRVVKYLSNWWLATPEGWPFLSFGMNATGDSDPTIITGREGMFTDLPDMTGPYAPFYGRITSILPGSPFDGDTFNFFKSNQYRKFGTNYQSGMYQRAQDRLISWGFNTLGAWSDLNLAANHRIPYTVVAQPPINHSTFIVDPKRVAMHDPFDANFRNDVRAEIAALPATIPNDPWCVGWFLDNEPTLSGGVEENGRYGIAYGVLKQSVFTSPAKVMFLSDLQDKYATIESLNAAWNTTYSSWETLAFPVNLPDQDGTLARKADFKAFCFKLQKEYFRIMDEELARVDARALFLGCRFFRFTTETLDAAALYCDVLSFNIYATALSPQWSTYTNINRPFMVSEFHFGSLDSGMFHPGLVAAANQTQRAQFFVNYMRSIADNKQFVGAHWHQYLDQPLTGRVINGENYNEGFVSTSDVPYSLLVNAARQVLDEAYQRRWDRN